jgi:hypothetical protein
MFRLSNDALQVAIQFVWRGSGAPRQTVFLYRQQFLA